MPAHSDVLVWAVQTVRVRVEEFERLRCEIAKHWRKGKRLHRLRTQARRLRAAVEDLAECIPGSDQLMKRCGELSDKTTDARDAAVLIRRLERYRRFAMPAERAEIRAICEILSEQKAKGLREAKRAVRRCTVEMES
ncbi:MAG: hypothetical protein NVSMB31_04930 [Vulcanimicrobiaceae bacterium]